MRLQLSTWQEVDSYLQRSTGILIPIGSTEQHGPNGLIGTDAICPEIIAFGVGQRIGAMVAPTISIGMAQHHMAFAGTITFRPTTFIAMLTDVVNALARHGFDRFYFLNGHGGNIATVTSAFSEIYAQSSMGTAPEHRSPIHCKLANWFMGPKVRQLSREMFGSSEGRHATPSEVSLSYFAYPDSVKQVEMTPKIAPLGEIRDAIDYRRQFPDGRIGSDPSLASVEAGERLYHASMEDVEADYQAFLNSPSS